MKILGLHHVTCIAGAAQENLDFYTGLLGLRLVKKSVNQDDPGTYHLFYADAVGHPGSDLTFFPWTQMAPSREGYGLSTEVALAVPPDSLAFWSARLQRYGVRLAAVEVRFGKRVLPFRDPVGLKVALVETQDSLARDFTPWDRSPISVEHQIRGLEGARMAEANLNLTSSFLENSMGFEHIGREGEWHRYGVAGGKSGCYIDLRQITDARRGEWGQGSIHHLAWRVNDEAHQIEVRNDIIKGGAHPTPVIDRFWFKSVYFKEPGGVLFELATDGPGFGVDEDLAHLGEALVLPPWLEKDRKEIEGALPKLEIAAPF